MSTPKYTPMQILRDNIKLKIDQIKHNYTLEDQGERKAYREILNMIEGEALGKPLLEQEYECLEQAYEIGVETEDLFKLDNYCEATFTLVPIGLKAE